MFDIEFSKSFAKNLDKLPTNVIIRFAVDVKKLQGLSSHYRLRVGKYRFLFTVIEDKVLVYFYDVGSRGDIYK